MEVEIDTRGVALQGALTLPQGAKSIVVFAHGSGSGRLSPRNNYVAGVLQKAGLGTLLFDLLTDQEDLSYENRFDIGLLSERLEGATEWLLERGGPRPASIGYFGASTGAAAALRASATHPEVRAIVSRGGRPDLAWDYLAQVTAPTMLVVGGLDYEVIELNRQAFNLLKVEKDIVVVPGATHLFEEPGTLEEVARVAADWFLKYLT